MPVQSSIEERRILKLLSKISDYPVSAIINVMRLLFNVKVFHGRCGWNKEQEEEQTNGDWWQRKMTNINIDIK